MTITPGGNGLPIAVLRFDHTAIAVPDIEDALPLYRDALGGILLQLNDNHSRGFASALLRYPAGGRIELLEPAGEGFVTSFLKRRGPGVHHLTFIVADIRRAISQARAAGLRVVDESFERAEWQEAFVSPRSASGTIVQLAQTTMDLDDRTPMRDDHVEAFMELRRRRREAEPTIQSTRRGSTL